MEKFRESMKEIGQTIGGELSYVLRNVPGIKKNYLKIIEKIIEKFRLMSEEKQREHFATFSELMENNLAEGGFDSKIYIKYWMHFFKIVKIRIFLLENDTENLIKIRTAYFSAIRQIEMFINELHGVEKIKENDFLNILNHEEKATLKFALITLARAFRTIMSKLNKKELDSNEDKKYFIKIKKNLALSENKIKKIIGGALRKVAEQEKINKLKIASEIFKEKAKKYKNDSETFLKLAILLTLIIFVAMLYKDDMYLTPESDVDGSAFYVYFILENLLSGRLLFPIIALTSFFYCLRFYAANNHNAIICDQRANTLESFEALYENVGKGKKGEEERLEVVKKVLNSATEHLPTGFSKLQSDSSGGGIDLSKLLSLFKGK